jgi:hypothetical protein
VVVLAGVQGVEVGDAVYSEHHSLAINDELRLADLPGCLRDPGKAPGPVQAAARRQLHLIAVALHAQPVAVVFDLVEPVRAAGHGFAECR